MRDDIVFTTLCICGEEVDSERVHFRGRHYYYQTCNILMHSVLKNTHSSLIIVTDRPDLFTSHERIKLVNIRDLTDEDLIKGGYMNFHLKRFAFEQGFLTDKKYTIYFDCDIFIDKFNYKLFDVLDKEDFDISGKTGTSSVEERMDHPATLEKIQQFDDLWNEKFFKMLLPHELFFIFKKNEAKQKMFMEFWNKLAAKYKDFKLATYGDCFYIGAAVMESEMIPLNLVLFAHDEVGEFMNGLRLIHSNHVNTIDAAILEKYEYEPLLQRVS